VRVGGASRARTTASSFDVTIGLRRRALTALKRLPRATLRLRISARGATRSEAIARSIAYVR
jgi:hypothetical protein